MIYWLYKALALLPLPIKYGLARVAAILLQRVFGSDQPSPVLH